MRYDPEGRRLPIKIDTTSNGEMLPRPLSAVSEHGNALAQERADCAVKKLGVSRRNFMISSAGAASTLMAINEAHAAVGATGGRYAMSPEAAFENAAADVAIGGRGEFIFDIQNHHVSPLAKWRDPNNPWALLLNQHVPGGVDTLTRDAYIKEVFLDSDTDVAVMTFVPTSEEDMPLSMEEAMITEHIVNGLAGRSRLLLHGRVMPNDAGDVARMERLSQQGVVAWKTYTQWKDGWWLDGPEFEPFAAEARRLNKKIICIHKGLPFDHLSLTNTRYSSPMDVGRAAVKYSDLTFVIYHSGWVPGVPEGPYRRSSNPIGVNAFLQSLRENGIGNNGNVYAEIGTTWHELMREGPDQQAHFMGKLLKYLGEDRIVWGTDCIWYGAPQDQIQAFRAFEISEEFQNRFGYPQLTPAVKEKIFGLNALRAYDINLEDLRRSTRADRLHQMRASYRQEPDPSFVTYGPRTRAEFLRYVAEGGV